MDNTENTPREIKPEGTVPKESAAPLSPVPVEPPVPAPAKEPVVFDGFDWLALVLGVALAALWFHVFDLESLIYVPGLGTTAFVLAALAAECIYLRGRLRPSRSGLFLVICTVLLAIAAGLFGDYSVRFINLALLACLTPASALALAGRDFPALELGVISETFRLFFPNLFRHFVKPFRALRRDRAKKSSGAAWIVLLTLLVMLPVFLLILNLLSSADEVFKGLLGGILKALADFPLSPGAVWSWIRAAVFGLMLFSFLYSLARPNPKREPSESQPLALPCLPFIAVLSVLDLIYAVFAVIQFIFLFGGARTAAMQGGYAQYARQGFFQLAAVAGINLVASLACVKASGRGKRALNILVWSLIGLTAVILASALFRMLMYIGVYGLSLLRCMTLLIMAWIAIALAAAAYKTAKPDFHVFPVFLSSFLVLWLIFNYVDIDARIDDYHRAAYESGRILSYDSDYITGLGPSASENASLEWQNRVLFPSHE